ncbi:hypothetical protein BHM03_00058712, partial [Ensete ventricosum]
SLKDFSELSINVLVLRWSEANQELSLELSPRRDSVIGKEEKGAVKAAAGRGGMKRASVDRWALKWIEDNDHNCRWQVVVTLLCGSGLQPQISDEVEEEEAAVARMVGARALAAIEEKERGWPTAEQKTGAVGERRRDLVRAAREGREMAGMAGYGGREERNRGGWRRKRQLRERVVVMCGCCGRKGGEEEQCGQGWPTACMGKMERGWQQVGGGGYKRFSHYPGRFNHRQLPENLGGGGTIVAH